MAAQLTIRLSEDLAKAIQDAARRAGLRRADIVRAALRAYFSQVLPSDSVRPVDLVRDLIGKVHNHRPMRPSSARQVLLDRIRCHAVRPA